MPNVPHVPGVPPLSSFGLNNAVLLAADLVSALGGLLLGPQWGIFRDGQPVILADNTVSFDLKQDLPISDYPVEQGGFQTYNKVQLPTDIRVRVSAGGSVLARQALLASIEAQMNTVDLYDIVTPEKVYLGYNFTHRDLHRTAGSGVGLIVVDLWLTEVRETATATFQNTQQPGNAGEVNIGNQQAQTPAEASIAAPSVGEFT